MGQNFVPRSRSPLFQQVSTVLVNEAKFQKGNFLDRFLGAFLDCFRKSRQLNQDTVVSLRLNDRLGHAEFVHALAQDFDRLGERDVCGLSVFQAVGVHLNQK